MIELFMEIDNEMMNKSIIYFDKVEAKIYDKYFDNVKISWITDKDKCTKIISWEE